MTINENQIVTLFNEALSITKFKTAFVKISSLYVCNGFKLVWPTRQASSDNLVKLVLSQNVGTGLFFCPNLAENH